MIYLFINLPTYFKKPGELKTKNVISPLEFLFPWSSYTIVSRGVGITLILKFCSVWQYVDMMPKKLSIKRMNKMVKHFLLILVIYFWGFV